MTMCGKKSSKQQKGAETMPECLEENISDESLALKERLKAKRDLLGLSNQAIADAADLSVHTVNNYFSNRSKATSAYVVLRIAKVLNCSVDDVCGIESDENPSDSSEEVNFINAQRQDEIIAMQERQITELRKDKRAGRFAIYLSVVLSAIVLIYFFHFDVPNPNWGFTKLMRDFFLSFAF